MVGSRVTHWHGGFLVHSEYSTGVFCMLNMIRENTHMFAFVRVTWITLSCQLVKCGAGARGRLMVHYKEFVRWSDGQIGMGGGEPGCICNFSKKSWPEIHTENAIKVKLSLFSFAICLCGSCCLTSIACVSTPDHHHSAVYLYPHVTLRLSDLWKPQIILCTSQFVLTCRITWWFVRVKVLINGFWRFG